LPTFSVTRVPKIIVIEHCVCEDYSTSKVGRFLRHGVYINLILSTTLHDCSIFVLLPVNNWWYHLTGLVYTVIRWCAVVGPALLNFLLKHLCDSNASMKKGAKSDKSTFFSVNSLHCWFFSNEVSWA